MIAAIYNISTTEVLRIIDAPEFVVDMQPINEGEAVLKDCLATTTHVVNGEPKIIIPEPTVEDQQKELTKQVQYWLDRTARERNYDNIFTAISYTNSTNEKFRAEALACVAWRDAVWSRGYELLELVKSGQLPAPTIEELLAQLPPMVWPT